MVQNRPYNPTFNSRLSWSTNSLNTTVLQSTTYLLEKSAKESEHCKDVVVWSEGVGDTDDDHRTVTGEKDRFTTELVRQRTADHSTEHHANDEYCLREVFEICTITDKIPLHK